MEEESFIQSDEQDAIEVMPTEEELRAKYSVNLDHISDDLIADLGAINLKGEAEEDVGIQAEDLEEE